MNEKDMCQKICDFLTGFLKKIKNNPLPWMIGFLVFLAGVAVIFGFKIKELFTCASILIAAAALTYQAHRNQIEQKQKRSKFYLDKYIEATEMILERLTSDIPTRRIAWVSAASMADKLHRVERKITESGDREYLDIYQRNYCHLILTIFIDKPAIYFTGNDEALSVEEALKPPTDRTSNGLASHLSLPSNIPRDTIKSILSLTNIIWEKEVGYRYRNDLEFERVVQFNYPELSDYLSKLKSRDSYPATSSTQTTEFALK